VLDGCYLAQCFVAGGWLGVGPLVFFIFLFEEQMGCASGYSYCGVEFRLLLVQVRDSFTQEGGEGPWYVCQRTPECGNECSAGLLQQ
jgi:hypothetical protein